ncbi:phosphate butyryltransferase [Spirochaetia bacterium]|nr:phosphate butyryltransferase [Spirochaetia bacterium]
MEIKKLDELAAAAGKALAGTGKNPPRIAVAAAGEGTILSALAEAGRLGLARPLLVGDRRGIEKAAEERGIDFSQWELVQEDNAAAAAIRAVELVRGGQAELAMKGLVPSAVFLKAVLRKDMGFNRGTAGGSIVSHAGIIEVPGYHKLLMISDGALNITPGLMEKAAILRNAVGLAHTMGISEPKAAILAGVETVNPERMPCTVDAAILTQMWRRGQFDEAGACIVDGPLALDNAVSAAAAKTKGINSPVAGDADILIVPNIEAGNILYKSLSCLGGAKTAGLILGTRVPVIVTSRADSAETKTASIALAVLAWLRL